MSTQHNVMELASNLDLESLRKQSAVTKSARVKIEKGHAWLIRLLPFGQGPKKESFAKLAQHWIGKRPVYCKTNTSSSFGGDPSYDCQICSSAATGKNEAMDDDEKDDFYSVEAREAFRCYCIVLKRQDDRGRIEETTGDDIFIAHEFNIPKSSFSTLVTKIERSATRKGASPLGLLDLETGCDIWVSRDVKNSLSFDLCEDGPMPIFDLNDQFDANVARVWKQMQQPSVKFLAPEREEALAEMISEKSFEKAAKLASSRGEDRGDRNNSRGNGARNGARGHSREVEDEQPAGRGRGRYSGVQEDNEQQEEAPRGRTSGRAGGFARASAALGDNQPTDGQDGGLGGDDDQIAGAEVPARGAGRRQQAQAEPEDEAPQVSSRRGGATARQAPTKVTVPAAVAAGRRAGSPPPPPPEKAGVSGRIEDDTQGGDDVPEEQRDPAPPESAEQEQAEAPPARSQGRGALGGALRNSVAKLASTGR